MRKVVNNAMADTRTIPAKYIFLDVVSFTHNRSVEAQTDIVNTLNQVVEKSLTEHEVDKDKVIFLPTGDGICIALLNVEDPYDIHINIALSIIKSIHLSNEAIENEMRKFQVRIGINANTDNLVTDINGKQNIAGAGINTAARVMSKADGNQILIGEAVYDTLRYREKYMNSFRGFNAEVKHGVQMKVYQYILEGPVGLNIKPPESFKPIEKTEKKFPKQIAYYISHLIKHKNLLIDKKENVSHRTYLKVVFWLLSKDLVSKSEARDFDDPLFYTHKFEEAKIDEQLEYYSRIDFDFVMAFEDEIDKHLKFFSDYFELAINYIFVNANGHKKLKSEWNEIWEEFELDKFV